MADMQVKNEIGRPTAFTEQLLKKLEEAFAFGATDKEACFYAGISPTALYNYQIRCPEFVERKEALKENPILKARQTVINSLDNPEHAKWYLERKAKNEFAQRHENINVELPVPLLENLKDENIRTSKSL